MAILQIFNKTSRMKYSSFALVIFLMTLSLTLAQTNTTQQSTVACPSDCTCFTNAKRNVTHIWGYNGHVCPGQSSSECYGENDPRGFLRGPRQWPVAIQLGDRLFFKATTKVSNLNLQPFNASKSSFESCTFNGAAVIPSSTSSLFEVPEKFLKTPGIKYFIVKSNSQIYSCTFGLKLEVYVRSREPCINLPVPGSSVCSIKGLCRTCPNTFFTFNSSCLCEAGYVGAYCEERNSCHSTLNPCRNGATCVDKQSGLVDDYSCICIPGYTGKNCETNTNECAPNPCDNGGLCLDKINAYECLCQPGYHGTNCSDLRPNPCEPNPCLNGGTCKLEGNNRLNYKCLCPYSFIGKNCSNNATLSSSVMVLSSSAVTATGKPSTVVMTPVTGSTLDISPSKSSIHSQKTYFTVMSLSQSSHVAPSQQTSVGNTSQTTVQETLSPQLSSSFTYSPSSSVPSVKPHVNVSTVYTSIISTVSSSVAKSGNHSVSLKPTVAVIDTSSAVLYSSTATAPMQSSVATSFSVEAFNSSLISSSTIFTSSSIMNSSSVIPQITRSISSGTLSTLTSIIFSTQTVATTSYSMKSSVSVKQETSSELTKTAFLTSQLASSIGYMSSSTVSVVALTTHSITSTSSVRTRASSTLIASTPSLSLLSSPSSKIPSTSVVPTTSSSGIILSSITSSLSSSSSVVPTTLAPTTVPLKEQTCRNNPCNSGTCLDVPDSLGFNFTCQCPKPTYGPRCSTDFKLHFPRFGNNSYLVHKSIAFASGFNKIVITFKTTQESGLLFYSTHSKYKDFIQLYVTNGLLEFRFDPGDSLVAIKSDEKVNTGNIITAVITYDSRNKEGSLKVNDNEAKKVKAKGRYVGINLYNEWYLGGLPPGKKYAVNDESKPTSTFNGCIKDLELNGDQISFTEATDWNNINECDQPCEHKPCRNNGTCTVNINDPHDYQCKCPEGFQGQNCKNSSVCSGDPCKGGLCLANGTNTGNICLCPFGREGFNCEKDINITIPTFSMVKNYASFIQYQTPSESGPYFAVTLQFSVDNSTGACKNSLLLFSGQDQYHGKGDDFVALGISENKVVFQYNLGSGVARISSDALDDSLVWHSVTAWRNGREGYLYVDNKLPKRGSSPGELHGLNLYSALYIGGIPDLTELPSNVEFKCGFQGSITSAGVRFRATAPFIPLLTSQTSGQNGWPVVGGRNIGDKSYDSCNITNPCQNNGTCVTKSASVTCSCTSSWKGMFCSSHDIPCISHNPCASKSTCREVNNKAVCDCPLGKTGATCSQALSIKQPKFKDNSYMAFKPTNGSGHRIYIRSTTNINITFNPSNQNGLLFYVAHKISSQKGDFLSISLHNGYVHYRYDLGSGLAKFTSTQTISLNKQHTLEVSRTSKSGTLKVDSQTAVSGISHGNAIALDVGSDFYLGGVPQLSTVNPLAVFDTSSLKDYVGCVSSVKVNDVTLLLTENGAKEGRNIANCPSSILS